MNAFQRTLKALQMRWQSQARGWSGGAGGWGGWWGGVFLPRTKFDYAREVGDGTGSALVMAPVLWIARTFPEAPPRVRRREADDGLTPLRDHPMIALLDRPNPYMSGHNLWMGTLVDFNVTGNAYWVKIRSGARRVVQLWYVPAALMHEAWRDDPGAPFIDHYEYRYDPARDPLRLDVADVVHFRFGVDPHNPRRGLAPLGSLLREVFTDDEAANFSAALVKNVGVPGVVIAPKDNKDNPVYLDVAEAEEVKQTFMAKFGGDRRGEPLVMQTPADISVLSFNPQQMDLRNLRFTTEERVCAVLGVPPMVVGFGAGLSRSTFSNMREAREAAYESNLIPTQRLFAAELKAQLLPDFGDASNLIVDFDLSEVRVMQEDQDDKAARVANLVEKGLLTRGEGREEVGQVAVPADDVFYVSTRIQVIGRTEIPAPPVTVPPALPPNVTPMRAQAGKGYEYMPLLPYPGESASYFSRGLDDLVISGHPQIKALDPDTAYLAALDLAHEALAGEMADELAATFRELGRAVAAQLPQGALVTAGQNGAAETKGIYDVTIGALMTPVDAAQRAIAALFHKWFGRGAEKAFGAASDRLGAAIPFRPDERDIQLLLRAGAARHQLVDVAGQTEAAIRQALADGRQAGDTPPQLAKRIEHLVEGAQPYPGIAAERGPEAAARHRSMVIARTETATAINQASALAFRISGVVDEVRVSDGDGCGWTGHDDPDRADGSVRSLEAATMNPLAHPHCRRRFTPILRGEG